MVLLHNSLLARIDHHHAVTIVKVFFTIECHGQQTKHSQKILKHSTNIAILTDH